jgi:selenide,water dikinase
VLEQTGARRLTEFSHGAGCGCKLGPGQLADVLARLAPPRHPDLLVGSETGDDAAVWRLDADRALVLTTDFFTPLVDDARLWGRIAATNAVSDVYAMGGRPLLALNLVAWNSAELSNELLAEVLAGAADVAAEGGWVIVGGHSVDDPEPKFGLAVVGEVSPDRVLTNAGLRAGDALVLTKPIGVGTVTTAIKLGRAPAAAVDAAVAAMTRTNAEASRVAVDHGATGATDVTGFGLLGHLVKMLEASGSGAVVEAAAVPLLPHTYDLAADGVVPGGTRRNLDWVRDRLDADGADPTLLTLLADAQTSGGLLFGVDPAQAEAAVSALGSSGHRAAVIGRVITGPARIRVT